jgi:hypothetical protein
MVTSLVNMSSFTNIENNPQKIKHPPLPNRLKNIATKPLKRPPSKHNKHSAIKNNTLKTTTPLSLLSPINKQNLHNQIEEESK